jgi:hypothetical protein
VRRNRTLLGLLLAALAGLVALRFLRRRGLRVESQPSHGGDTGGEDPRVQELRRTLDQVRRDDPDAAGPRPVAVAAPSSIELAPPPEPPPFGTSPLTPEEIAAERRRVHERARSAVDEMRGPTDVAGADGG